MPDKKIPSIAKGKLPFNPLGPVPHAKLLLENKFKANPANILDRADDYLNALNEIADIDPEEFRAFFWSVNDEYRLKMSGWIRKHTPNFQQIDFKNHAVLTTLFYLYGIKGIVFSRNLLEEPLDPVRLDLSEPNSRELFDDLARIFQFMRKGQDGTPYLEKEDVTAQSLKNSIQEWQETESRFKIRHFDTQLKSIPDGILREEDLLVLYSMMSAHLQLNLEIIYQVIKENEISEK